MTGSTPNFKEHIRELESTFSLCLVLFKRYRYIFGTLFGRQNLYYGNQLSNINHLNSAELFYFTWLLYAQIKATVDCLKKDLISCFYLLICCVEFVIANLMQCGRIDLLDEKFLDRIT